jgi:hypothetical protein
MDATLKLIELCHRVIEAGTMQPGEWAMQQRPLVRLCREVLNQIGEERQMVKLLATQERLADNS